MDARGKWGKKGTELRKEVKRMRQRGQKTEKGGRKMKGLKGRNE